MKREYGKEPLERSFYLFGSFADSTYSENSDFDFYIVVHDAVSDIPAETTKAYKSIRKVKQRPVDIVVGTVSHFEARKEIPSIENEVYRKGVLLYDTVILGVSAGSSNMAKHALDIWESPVPYDGLGLADITIKAHVTHKNQELLQTLSQISMEQNLPICAMEDESAIFVKENEVTYVGQILWINNGNICQVSQKVLEQMTAGKLLP